MGGQTQGGRPHCLLDVQMHMELPADSGVDESDQATHSESSIHGADLVRDRKHQQGSGCV